MQEQKIYGRREGAVGHLVFNNPAKLNAVSLDMWDGLRRHPEGLRQGPRGALRRGERRRRQGLRVGRRHLQVRERARQCGGAGALRRDLQGRLRALYNFPKPTIAKITGYCIGGGMNLAGLLRPALLQRGRALRRAGRQARPGLRLPAHRAAVAHHRPAARHGVPVHGQAVFGARRPTRWAWCNGVAADAELDALVADITDAIAQNAPLTIALAKAVGARDRQAGIASRTTEAREHGQGLLRQRGLQGRPPRLHGESASRPSRDVSAEGASLQWRVCPQQQSSRHWSGAPQRRGNAHDRPAARPTSPFST